MRDYLSIGSSPLEEDCAQVGAANYHALSKLELAAFKQAIIAKFDNPPDGASLGVKDGEVVVFFDDQNEKAVAYAYEVEGNCPLTWEEVKMKAPRLDDEEFTKTELIAVPVPPKGRWVGLVERCNLADTPPAMGLKARECVGAIGNEFIDGSVKGSGQWAIMCPACFGQSGVGLGTGRGQRYRKATDQEFYKVEG